MWAQDATSDPVVHWKELETESFVLVYAERVTVNGEDTACVCGIAEAEYYAGFVDDLYRDMASLFGVELDRPIELQLFPTEESYYAVNPLAERLTGVIAHALNTEQEIAIALPRTQPLTEDEIINNVRHELAHLFSSVLSDGNLTTPFQEGIAQYLEKPVEHASYDPAVLRQAQEQGRLVSWAELDEPGRVYSDPQVAYPQTLSMVAFLADRYGFDKLLDFARAAAIEPGYRSALEAAFGTPADALEAEWLAYLPAYLDGRWQVHVIYAYDLSRVTQLVEEGAFTGALAELEEIVALLETTNQRETLAEAEALLARVHQAQTAGALADQARQALQTHEYARAIEMADVAVAAYEQLGYRERLPELRLYARRAARGQAARQILARGEQLLASLRFAEAEAELYEATATLQALGDQDATQRGLALLEESLRRQQVLAHGLLVMGAAVVGFGGLRRLVNRRRPRRLEVDFT